MVSTGRAGTVSILPACGTKKKHLMAFLFNDNQRYIRDRREGGRHSLGLDGMGWDGEQAQSFHCRGYNRATAALKEVGGHAGKQASKRRSWKEGMGVARFLVTASCFGFWISDSWFWFLDILL